MFYEAVLALCTVCLTLSIFYGKRIVLWIDRVCITEKTTHVVGVSVAMLFLAFVQFSLFGWVLSLYAIFNGGKYGS